MSHNLEELLLYRDASVLVINKPANIAVHPGFGDTDTLDKYFPQLQYGLPQPPQLAHRLDRATSGCLVLGRHKQALKQLSHLFATQQIEKTYLAVVVGKPPEESGSITFALAKQSQHKHRWWMKIDENGQTAHTDYRVVSSNGELSVVELTPKTGRTHQLRVHTAAAGFPILGEWMYQGEVVMPSKVPLQLHAKSISIPMNAKKAPIFAEAPLPEHMEKVIANIT